MEKTSTITLKFPKPFIRGKGDNKIEIYEVEFREPNARDMTGLTTLGLTAGDVNQLSVLVPRISEPQITSQEVARMSFNELASISGALLDFLQQSKVEVISNSTQSNQSLPN